jgi:hypothetical protein
LARCGRYRVIYRKKKEAQRTAVINIEICAFGDPEARATDTSIGEQRAAETLSTVEPYREVTVSDVPPETLAVVCAR